MRHILVGCIMDGKSGGIDKYLLNFLDAVLAHDAENGSIHSSESSVVRKDIQIDFLTDQIHGELEQYLKQYQSQLFAIPGLRNPIGQYRAVCEILESKPYDTIYLNVSTAIDWVAVFAAKKKGIPNRLIHSHSSGNDCESSVCRVIYNVVHRMCKPFFYKLGTRFYGCSVKAGEWIFPKKIVQSEQFAVIYNAVDRKRFVYDPNTRATVREELDIKSEKTFVVGHMGNFCYAKNYPFLLNVFAEIYKKDNNAVLLLAGTGVEMEEVKQRVEAAGLCQAVKFLGWRADADRLYQAMDLFLLPSRFEGLPIVGVEAQCCKLMTVFSDSITRESKIQQKCYFLSLQDLPAKWAEFILEHREYKREDVQLMEVAEHYSLEKQQLQLRRIVCR